MPNIIDLDKYLAVIGSRNTRIKEDPVLGSNGTAVLVRYNSFIRDVVQTLNSVIPNSKGSLLTVDASGNSIEFGLGANRQVLTVKTDSPSGLLWDERVDLVSDQTIDGLKEFLRSLKVGGLLSTGPGRFNSSLQVDDYLIANGIQSTSTLQVDGASHLKAPLLVEGATTLHSWLDVQGQMTVRGNSSLGGTLSVVGASNLSSTLTVGGSTTLSSTLTVGGEATLSSSASVQGSLTVGGKASLGNDLSVGGAISVTGTSSFGSNASIGGALSVQGSTSLSSLIASGNAQFNGSLTAPGTVALGPTTIGSTLNVTGLSTLGGGADIKGNLLVDSLGTRGSLSVGTDLSVTRKTQLGDSLEVVGSIQALSGLSVGSSLTVANTLEVSGATLLRSNTTLMGQTLVQNSLTVDGLLLAESNLRVDGLVSTGGDVDVEGNLRTGTLQSVGAATVGSLSSRGDISTTGKVTATNGTFDGSLQVNGALRASGGASLGLATAVQLDLQDDLIVRGDATFYGATHFSLPLSAPNLSGVNTGDEPPATPTVAGRVYVSSSTSPLIPQMVYTKEDVDTRFIPSSSIGKQGGVAPLDSSGTIPEAFLPPKAVSTVTVVSSASQMLALPAQEGDVAVRMDEERAYMLGAGPSTSYSSWVPLTFNIPTSPVNSVFGRQGVVEAQRGDYTASQVGFTPVGSINAVETQGAITMLLSLLLSHEARNDNPHKVTLSQLGGVPISSLGMPNGVAQLDSNGNVIGSQLPKPTEIVFDQSRLMAGVLRIAHGSGQKIPLPTILNGSLKAVIPDEVTYDPAGNYIDIELTSFVPLQGDWTIITQGVEIHV